MHEFLLMNPSHLLIQIANYSLIHVAFLGAKYGYQKTETWVHSNVHRKAHYEQSLLKYSKLI